MAALWSPEARQRLLTHTSISIRLRRSTPRLTGGSISHLCHTRSAARWHVSSTVTYTWRVDRTATSFRGGMVWLGAFARNCRKRCSTRRASFATVRFGSLVEWSRTRSKTWRTLTTFIQCCKRCSSMTRARTAGNVFMATSCLSRGGTSLPSSRMMEVSSWSAGVDRLFDTRMMADGMEYPKVRFLVEWKPFFGRGAVGHFAVDQAQRVRPHTRRHLGSVWSLVWSLGRSR